ncbi:MAG TPA: hypothetical protein VKZ67_04885 [Natronosporangium sp.]|jgi:hypothetical protein|nr:hypothetical protein [Natronosporangium sp.]
MPRIRRGWRTTGAVISGLVLLGLVAGPLPDEAWRGGVPRGSEGGGAVDAGSGAATRPRTASCARTPHSWQNTFAKVVSTLERDHPGQLAHAAIVDDGCAALLMFRGAVPDQAATLTAPLPVPVRLVGDRGYSQDELVEVLQSTYYAIVHHPRIAAASGVPVTERGLVVIHAQPDGPTTRSERNALCRQLRPAAPANPAIRIQLILTEYLHHPATRLHPC